MLKPTQQGFTLLELLVTLAIVALMVSLAMPRVGGVLVTAELQGEVRKVASLLRHARSQAVLLNQDIQIRLGEEPPVLSIDGRERFYRPPEHVRLKITAAAEAAHEWQADETDPVISFFAVGGSNGGSIVLSLEDGRRSSVGIDWLSGRVHIDE